MAVCPVVLVPILLLFTAAFVAYCVRMPGRSYRGKLPALTDEEAELERRLKAHVERLSSEIGERNYATPDQLSAAAQSIRHAFEELGLQAEVQSFKAYGMQAGNIESELTGREKPDEIIVLGAHYDTVVGSPGADDNATGIAALIEIARLLSKGTLARTVRFAAFANEEPPFFKSGAMGSYQYARRCRDRDENIVAMFSLESLGHYSDRPNSQRYPPLLGLVYPDRADFIAFVGNLRSRALVRQSIRVFRSTTPFPSEGIAAPPWVPGIDFSDQWSFWRHGYPAVMVTDTPIFRNPHYHRSTDTADRIRYGRLARVVGGIALTVEHMANR